MKTFDIHRAHLKTRLALAASLLMLGAQPSLAEKAVDHGGHRMPAAGNAVMADTGKSAQESATPVAAPMVSTDHDSMNMQGGAAPADARDPHEYSGGYTLDSGKYALAGPRQLRLADEHGFGTLLFDRLERVGSRDTASTAFDVQAWVGRDYDRFVVKIEGDYSSGRFDELRTELLWGHAIASYWDSQLGLRHDTGEGPDRTWLAVGVQGLAPYWFELDAAAYLGERGRTALRVEVEYELPITQQWVLQPRGEINLYGKKDEANGLGSGLTDATVGLRLRYEVSRRFAPYIGVEWHNKFGRTADLARAENEPTRETRWVAGLRFWF